MLESKTVDTIYTCLLESFVWTPNLRDHSQHVKLFIGVSNIQHISVNITIFLLPSYCPPMNWLTVSNSRLVKALLKKKKFI